MPAPRQLLRSVSDQLPPQARSAAGRAIRQVSSLRATANEPYQLWRSRLADDLALSVDAGVAFVGCGAQARNIAGAVTAGGGRVMAAHDERPDVAAAFLRDFDPGDASRSPLAHPSPSLDALLENRSGWSALVIATTASSHVPIGLAAIEAGVERILVEKPVATSVADARRLLRAAEASSVRAAVNHTRRWLPSALGLRRLIESKAVGEVRAINFMWGRNGLAMIGTHLFDFARLLTGSEIEAVRCELDTERRISWRGDAFVDQPGWAQARMADGTRISIDLSGDLPTQQGFAVIVGENGRIELDEPRGRVRMVGRGRREWTAGYGFTDALTIGAAMALVQLHGVTEPACSLADGIAALEAVVGCQLSSRNGGDWVPLPLDPGAEAEVFPFA